MFFRSQGAHLPDGELLLAVDGELCPRHARRTASHLASCWSCRARQWAVEQTIADFVRLYQRDDGIVPPAEGPRALLKVQLAGLAAPADGGRRASESLLGAKAIVGVVSATVIVIAGWLAVHIPGPAQTRFQIAIAIPNSTFTPGAMVFIGSRQVSASQTPKNQSVPDLLWRRVFEEYGIEGANPGNYELDYLIKPALAGTEDIHNLWRRSYSSTVWNAQVKDRLEIDCRVGP